MNKLRMAVVGAGHLGKIHARILSGMSDIELVGVADPVAAARQQVAADCKTEAFADYRDLIGKIDGAVIATPTRLHHGVSVDLLDHGVHLMVEKPIAATLSEADEMVTMAKRRRVTLQVGHIERFNPALTVAAPYVRDPKFIEATRASGYTFRSTDIGVVLDLMIHDLDVVMSLAASPVRRVDAMGLAIMGRYEDVAHARLEFENGCVANLNASRVSYVAKRVMQVWSSRAMSSLDFSNRTAQIVCPSAAVMNREIELESLPAEEKLALKDRVLPEYLPLTQLTGDATNAIGDELADFARAIRESSAPRVTGEQGRDVLAVAEQVLAEIDTHSWNGKAGGPSGPRAVPAAAILRGPHWDHAAKPLREAG